MFGWFFSGVHARSPDSRRHGDAYNSTDATAYIKTANTETIKSTVGATQHVVAMPAAGATIRLTAISTARWVTETTTASGINLTNTT